MTTAKRRIRESPTSEFAARLAAVIVLLGGLLPGWAFAYPGQALLQFAQSNIIAPLGIVAVVVSVAGAIFRPEMVKTGVWAAVICAFLFAIISAAPTLISAMQAG